MNYTRKRGGIQYEKEEPGGSGIEKLGRKIHRKDIPVVKSETYTDVLIQSRSSTTARKEENRIQKPKEEWVKKKNTHEPLISLELYKKALGIRCRIQERTHAHGHCLKATEEDVDKQDIHFFILHPMIQVIAVVSNQGTVHYLKRDIEYEYIRAFELFRECIEGLKKESPALEMYMAALTFLAECRVFDVSAGVMGS